MTKLENGESISYEENGSHQHRNGNGYVNGNREEFESEVFYRIVPLTDDQKDKAAEFLKKSFFKDEPLNVAVGLKSDDESHARLQLHCVKYISEGLSLAAISESGDILGLCLNGAYLRTENGVNQQQTNNNEWTFDKSKADEDVKADRILHLLDTLKDKSDVFGQFPNVDKILDIFIVSVDNAYRGKGICKALIDKTREMARENNFSLIKVDCTSHFTAKAASRLGFKCIYSLPYDSVIDSEGHPVVKPDLPHVNAETYVTLV